MCQQALAPMKGQLNHAMKIDLLQKTNAMLLLASQHISNLVKLPTGTWDEMESTLSTLNQLQRTTMELLDESIEDTVNGEQSLPNSIT